jgi:hypothetical protein
MFQNIPPPPPRKSCRLWDNVKKYGEARQAADDNMATRCVVDNWSYKRASTHPRPYTHYARTHTEIYTYCYSTVRVVSRNRLNITLYIHRFSFARRAKQLAMQSVVAQGHATALSPNRPLTLTASRDVSALTCRAGCTLSGRDGGLSSSLLGVEVWRLLPPGLYCEPDCGRGSGWCCWWWWCCCCWCWVSCKDHHCSNFRRQSSLGSGTWVPGAEWGVRQRYDSVTCRSVAALYTG